MVRIKGLGCLRSCKELFLLPLALLLAQTSPSLSEYRLGIGDVVELSIAGLPDSKQRATINSDGAVTFALLGQVRAAGMSLSELRAAVGQGLSSKFLYNRTPDGREVAVTIRPEEATITLLEYRPVYINGDVAKPGEQAFKPQMTVRQALAVAGGYDVMRFRISNPFIEGVDLRTEYESLWTEFAKERLRVARIEAELAGKPKLDLSAVPREEVPSAIFSQLARLEAEQLTAREADLNKERAMLKQSIAQTQKRLSILLDQQKAEQQGSEEDVQELERVKALFAKGNIPITRVNDSRRALLLSSTRYLETSSEAARVERERDEFKRKLEKVDDQRKLDLLRELQDGKAKSSTLAARIQGVSEKLLYVGAMKSQVARGGNAEPRIVVYRTEDSRSARITATEDTELRPGDVVEVAILLEDRLTSSQ